MVLELGVARMGRVRVLTLHAASAAECEEGCEAKSHMSQVQK